MPLAGCKDALTMSGIPAAPIFVFLPTRDEQETVAAVVNRVPAQVGDHPVEVVVIDDGSSDSTARRAGAAGAEVVSFTVNRGLGAAVRARAGRGSAPWRGGHRVPRC